MDEFQTRIIAAVERFVTAYERTVPRGRPGLSKLRITGEKVENGMDVLTFEIDLPAEPDQDVTKRRYKLTDSAGVILAEGEQPGREASVIGPFQGEQDSSVILSFANVDDSDNESTARAQTFKLIDTIAPASPGEAGLRVTGEANVEPQ